MEKRYINNLTIEEMKKIQSAKICVIGCGSLGGYVIEGLVRSGFESLTVVDNGLFDNISLNKELYATEATLRTSKAQAASERVLEINPRIKINPVTLRFDEKWGKKIIKNYDIVIDAVDNIDTKLLIEKFSKELNIPIVHGDTFGFHGQVAIILPGEDSLEKIYSINDFENEFNSSITPSTTANIMVSETLKLYLNKGYLHKQLLVIDLEKYSFDITDIK